MTQLAQLRIHHSLPKGENLWMSGAAIVRHAGAVGKLIRAHAPPSSGSEAG
jgi:hypothetical protein